MTADNQPEELKPTETTPEALGDWLKKQTNLETACAQSPTGQHRFRVNNGFKKCFFCQMSVQP